MEFLKKHGEKILLLLLIAGLALSVVMGLAQVGSLQNPDTLGLVAPPGGATMEVGELDATLARLTGTPPTVEVGMNTFTPEIRVTCINQGCKSLIHPDAEICPYCGEKQTVGPRDSDGDGITDDQESEWGMDPFDSKDALSDIDGDGFPTLYEHDHGYDPTDPDSMPDLVEFVRLKNVEQSSIEFELRGTATLGEAYTLQLFWKYPGERNGTTEYVRTGRKFGRNNEFLAESFTEKRTLIGDRYVDESIAVIRGGRYELKLGRNPQNNKGMMTESAATIETIFGPETEMTVRVDETIQLGKKSYNVVDINRNTVVLQSDVESDPQPDPILIKAQSPADNDFLEKYLPARIPEGENFMEGMSPDGMIPQDFF